MCSKEGNGFYGNTMKHLLQKGGKKKGKIVKAKSNAERWWWRGKGENWLRLTEALCKKGDEACERAEESENLWLVLIAHSLFSSLALSHVHPPSSNIYFDPVNLPVNLNHGFRLAASVMWPHTRALFQPHLLSWRCSFLQKKSWVILLSMMWALCLFSSIPFSTRPILSAPSLLLDSSLPLVLFSQYLLSLTKSQSHYFFACQPTDEVWSVIIQTTKWWAIIMTLNWPWASFIVCSVVLY